MSLRRWLPAVGLVAVLAGCGGSGGDGSSDAAPEPAPAESSPATTEPAPDASTDEPAPASTEPAANAAPGTFNWTLVDEAPLYADDSHALGAASNGEEVIGVGYRSTDGAEEIAVAWRTRDGRTWERSELPQPAGAGLGGSNALAASAWSGGWVVAGVLKGDDPALAVWTSSDGETWAAVESPAFADDEERIGGVSPSAVAASETAIVVGGAAETIDQGAAVWRSTDGLVWQRVQDDELRASSVHDVASDGTGFVGIGTDIRSDLRSEGVVWRSEDGEEWRRVRSPALGAGGEDVALEAVAYGGGRWWIAGHQLTGDPADVSSQTAALAMWSSADGETWQREPQGAIPYDLDMDVDDVAVLPAGEVVVIGTSTDVSLPHPAAASWTRAANGTWRQQGGGALQGNGSVTGNGVAALGDVPVAVGTTVILDEPGEEDDGGVLNYDAVAFLGSPITG